MTRDVAAGPQPRGKEQGTTMLNGFDEVQKVGRESVTRTMESFGALSQGVQAIAVEAADYSKRSFEQGAAHVQALMGAKSLDRAVEVQADYVRSACEEAVGQATRMGELYVELAKDVVRPYEGLFPAVAR
jgi:hypothetical protein